MALRDSDPLALDEPAGGGQDHPGRREEETEVRQPSSKVEGDSRFTPRTADRTSMCVQDTFGHVNQFFVLYDLNFFLMSILCGTGNHHSEIIRR